MASVARRLFAAVASIAVLHACGVSHRDVDESGAGREGEQCYGNRTCNPGLTCLSNRCVVVPGDGGAGGEDSTGGTAGGGTSNGGTAGGGTSNAGSSSGGSSGGEETGGSTMGGMGGTGGVGGDAGSGGAGMGGAVNGGAAGAGQGGMGGGGTGPGGQGGTGGQGGSGGQSGTGNQGGMGGGGRGGFGNFGGGGVAGSSGAGRGGAGGMTGGQGGGGTGGGTCAVVPTIAELFPAAVPTGQSTGLTGNPSPAGAAPRSFDGFLRQTPCTATSCDDCSSAGWVYEGVTTTCNGGLNAIQNFTVGGVPGERYRVTLHFYGVVEPKNYGGAVTRASGTMRPSNLDTGATPPPWAYAIGNPNYQQSDYNTYEIHVVDHNGMEVCSHFLNSDTSEGHWTYILNYEKTIDVIGGGRIRVRSYDRNCRMIKNCQAGGTQGPCSATGCNNKARTVNVSAANPQPQDLMQPGLGNAEGQSGQWVYIDVLSVTCGPTPLTCAGL